MKLDSRVLALAAVFSLNCNAYSQDTVVPLPIVAEEQDQKPTISHQYATTTGLELEKAYQDNLKTQAPGRHFIFVGEYGKPGDALYIGDVSGAVKTLQHALQGTVEVKKYPKDFTTSQEILNILATSGQYTTAHFFGHGSEDSYWVTLFPSDDSLTRQDFDYMPQQQVEILRENLASDGYWKFYGCHMAADSGITGENITESIAENTGIPVTAANSWVFIHGNRKKGEPVYMYPVSRAEFERYFTKQRPDYPMDIPDQLYTGESAWVTYTLIKNSSPLVVSTPQ